MKLMTLYWLLALSIADGHGSTHWLVTETGLVQPRADSPFEMARPYDLLAFLNQDTRWDNIRKLYNYLSKQQVDINKLWTKLEEESNINSWLSINENCRKTGSLDYLNWYATRMEEGLSKSILPEDYLLYNPSFGEDVDVPDCKKISSLTFSMFAFEHLEAMVNRENLSIQAELALPDLIAPLMTVEQFGHWVASALRRNSSSWLHYNMASLYWRVRGKAAKALECSRRALHYVSREYKDIALLSMGTVLHRARRPRDAVTVLTAAVDHDPACIEAHFVLAHAYAVLADFNSSIAHYDETIRLNAGYDQAVKNRLGVFCVQDLVVKMKNIHKILIQLREELTEYTAREALWLKSQSAFLRTMKHNEEFDYRNVDKVVSKMSEMTNLSIKELKKEGDKNSLIKYFLDGPLYNDKWFEQNGLSAVEAAFSMHRLVKHISKHAEMASDFVIQPDVAKMSDGVIKKEIGPLPAMPELAKSSENLKVESQLNEKSSANKKDDETFEFELGVPLYPSSMKVSRGSEDFDRDPDWPSDAACKSKPTPPDLDIEAVHPVFLPFENKGLRLSGLLSDRIGLDVDTEHELPWHPPVCPPGKGAAAILKKANKQQLLPDIIPTDYLRRKLLSYLSDGLPDHVAHMQEAEIGQRIYTAMQANVAPKWMMYTLASLYWRARGNTANALGCLLAASKHVRAKHKDIPLTSLASVYMEMGFLDEAMLVADEAYRVGPYEPAVNFLLAQINMLRKQRNSQMFHLKQCVRVDPNYLQGTAKHLLLSWACLLKQVDALEVDFGEGDVCTQVEPGVSMVCNKGNVNCHVANIQCFTHSEKESTSTFVRLLSMKQEPDVSVFLPFIQHMPLERTDKEGHAANFNNMVAVIDSLQGCQSSKCRNMKPEDLALKEEDCTHQYLQLGYWLHIISFRQLITEYDLRLPPEIITLTPSSKKVPECRIYGDPNEDFFLERLSRIDTEGWEPVISLMHQFADMFQHQDYVTLGAKFAKYIETRGRVWTGLLGAGWWCGAGGRGGCARRCLAAAYQRAPAHRRVHALRALAALLHMQGKTQEAKDIALLTFYMSPKSKTEAFLVAVSNTYQGEYEQAVWMYRYALSFDDKYLPAKACLHATMCIMLFGEDTTKPAGVI